MAANAANAMILADRICVPKRPNVPSILRQIHSWAPLSHRFVEKVCIFFACFVEVKRLTNQLSVNKPGECPTLGNSSRCDRECYTDADCRGDSKCCTAGCGYVCVLPAETAGTEAPEVVHPPVYYPGAQAPQLEDRPQEEIDVVQPEGDMATLRCFATGYPLPTVTWKRGQVIVSSFVDGVTDLELSLKFRQ